MNYPLVMAPEDLCVPEHSTEEGGTLLADQESLVFLTCSAGARQ